MKNKETLEEAAERYANDWEEIHPELDPENMTPIAVSKIDFTEGAKYQQEQDKNKYSEEDMKLMFEFGYRKNNFTESTFKDALNYIKQKKK